MEPLTEKYKSALAESISTYATLRVWGLFSSYRRDSVDGETLWEQPFETWKADYLSEMAVLKETCTKLDLGEPCLSAIENAMDILNGVNNYKDLNERQLQRRMKKWQTILSGRLRDQV